MRTRLFDAYGTVLRQPRDAKADSARHSKTFTGPTLTTLEFLDYLLSPGRGLPDKLLLTYRSAETHRADVEDWLDRLRQRSDVRLMELRAAHPIRNGRTDRGPVRSRRRALNWRTRSSDRSEGNAFFTDQLVAAAQEQSADDRTITALLPGLTSLLLSRARPVHGLAREIMFALAVATHPLEEHQLVSLCHATEPGVRPDWTCSGAAVAAPGRRGRSTGASPRPSR